MGEKKNSSSQNSKGKHVANRSTSFAGSTNQAKVKHFQDAKLPPLNGYSQVPGVSNTSSKGSSYKKRVFIVIAVIIAILAAIYGGGVLFFSSHFFPNTVLNDQDLSLQPSEALANQIQSQADSYSLTITGEGFPMLYKTR